MSTLFSLADATLARRLERLAALAWLPGTLLDIVGGTLRLQRAAFQSLSRPDTSGLCPAASEAHAQGAPLLASADFPYDPDLARPLWAQLCDLLASAGGNPAEAVSALRREVAADEELPARAYAAFTHEDEAFFTGWAARLPQAPALIHFLAQAALTPQLAAVTETLAAGYDEQRVWEHGHCPHCGRPPFMGELRGREGQRWHTCSFCGASYRAARLQCPFCLERGEERLRVFTTDSLPFFEVRVCKTCRCYIKLADLREQAEALPAALSDLASLPLDMLARQEGYSRPTPSAWGF
ncbi:MAG: formate dehydrogenase accessory protein FdhE [Desulfovibrio sp.]|uniref:formate dehydrogenase accessory protein FdhE n=1 Tax=Desulfovibrio sp. TaxID=885 RepID=UPI002586A5AE|nr:formate dehydrogenase accessory protein FdhE [Desulfovibrio sp.]MCD7984038.1 formate dehydrogenase accessory protein FdhE [Desulfovibrio sp.]